MTAQDHGHQRDARRWAQAHIDHGFAIFAIPARSKIAVTEDWPHLTVMAAEIPQLFAPTSNIAGKIGEPSGNVADVDLDCWEALRLADVFLPATRCTFGHASKPRSHRLYRITDGGGKTLRLNDPVKLAERPKNAMLAELRWTGCYTLLPGSVHDTSGEPILFDGGGWEEPPRITWAELEAAFLRLTAAALLARYWPGEGSRHLAALALSGVLARAAWDEQEAATLVRRIAEAAGDEEAEARERDVHDTYAALRGGLPTTGQPTLEQFLDARAIRRARQWLGLRTPTRPSALEADLDNARRLEATYGREGAAGWRLLFCTGAWYAWDGTRWRLDEGEHMAHRYAAAIVDQLRAERRQDRGSVDAGNARRIKGLLEVAARLEGFFQPAGSLDHDPYLLTCAPPQAVTLNLRTDETHPPRPDDLITKCTAAPYDPDATHPHVEWLLAHALPLPEARRDIFTFLGYCLPGRPKEHLGIFHGDTKSGKSTLARGVANALGDYASAVDISTFTAGTAGRSEGGRAREDLVALVGRRFIVASEANMNARLNAAELKTLTGADKQSIRANYGKQFETLPTYGIVLLVNDLPKLPADDAAAWERVHVFHFGAYIQPDERDEHARDETVDPAISGAAWLALVLAGWRRYRDELRERLRLPSTVWATGEYRRAEDVVAQFIAECCPVGEAQSLRFSDFKRAFHHWARQQDVREQYTDQRLGRILAAKGYRSTQVDGARVWQGLGLYALWQALPQLSELSFQS